MTFKLSYTHFYTYLVVMGQGWREGGGDALRDVHLDMMSTFVNVKIVRFTVIVNKERKQNKWPGVRAASLEPLNLLVDCIVS